MNSKKKHYILFGVVMTVLLIVSGYVISIAIKEHTSYDNSNAEIISQHYVPGSSKYAYIVGLRTFDEYKYKRNVNVSEIVLSDGTTSKQDEADTNGVNIGTEGNKADLDMMNNLFDGFSDSSYNRKVKNFKVGTRVQTSYKAAHYEVVFTSSWNSKKNKIEVSKPFKYKNTNIGTINNRMNNNKVRTEYYAY
ncbi:hypothetical protein HOR11_gp055 [Lactobacillus phage SA-C12]|uniref:Uncharacterized protein n=1 Tax=Lactobacillus phage SA-C12 TaxID=1755697 RepID=A0A1I9KK80_9CAUD|nr:hypothetical protein HOR11_gp055 [Lactobacillus phage SA-C12]ALY06876.1 hypothetical protein SAC12_055 [Lactobacillus phage SA-C12]